MPSSASVARAFERAAPAPSRVDGSGAPTFNLAIVPRHAAAALDASPRVNLVRDFLAHLTAETRAGRAPNPELPHADIRVEIVAKECVLAAQEWVGRFLVGSRAVPQHGWCVQVAFGGNYAHPLVAEEALLVTTAHELEHLGDWARLSGGRPPDQVPYDDPMRGAFAALQSARYEEELDERARDVVYDGRFSMQAHAAMRDPSLLCGIDAVLGIGAIEPRKSTPRRR